MGLLKKIVSSINQEYDMDTLNGIESIPVPAKTPKNSEWPVYYMLQRKATEHKKNGKMDLAIACLRKSNKLSDYESNPPLLEKDYLRLVKYIKTAGNPEQAEIERQKIYQKHPEFLDKRLSNLPRIKEQLKKAQEWKIDLVQLSTSKSCPICSTYNDKTYSISGRNRKYPKLPSEVSTNGGFCKNCSCSLLIMINV